MTYQRRSHAKKRTKPRSTRLVTAQGGCAHNCRKLVTRKTAWMGSRTIRSVTRSEGGGGVHRIGVRRTVTVKAEGELCKETGIQEEGDKEQCRRNQHTVQGEKE